MEADKDFADLADPIDDESFDNPEIDGLVRKSHQSTSLQQLAVLQRIVFEDATLKMQKAADLNQLVRAWDVLEERKRILRGRPLPGSLNQKVNKQVRSSAPLVILEPESSDEQTLPIAQ